MAFRHTRWGAVLTVAASLGLGSALPAAADIHTDYLEQNKTKEGVQVTDSGLQYRVIKEGTGKQPKATDMVEVHYVGTLPDGTEFDSSYKNNAPISFPLNGVIPGWTEGVQLMREGATYEFTIPGKLAYGAAGVPGVIPPNATLIFKVELLEIK